MCQVSTQDVRRYAMELRNVPLVEECRENAEIFGIAETGSRAEVSRDRVFQKVSSSFSNFHFLSY